MRRLLADRDDFMALYPSHAEAARIYERRSADLERAIWWTFSRRWRKRLTSQRVGV